MTWRPHANGSIVTESRLALLPWLSLSALITAADQVTKWLVVQHLEVGDRVQVLPIFSWVRWHNDGAAFSLLSGGAGRWFFVVLALGFAVFIIYELRRLPVPGRLMACAYALILGGAIGNGFDRLILGYVVDFTLVHYGDWYFPAFNVADASLTLGAACWLWALLLEHLHERRARAA